MNKTLIILNPNAAGGRAGRIWTDIQPYLELKLGDLDVHTTYAHEDVKDIVKSAYERGLRRVLSVGGDGTNHVMINALAEIHQQHPDSDQMIYGMIPIGTGKDWARSSGIPFDAKEAAHWLTSAKPHATDLGLLEYVDASGKEQRRYFLNIASTGLGGEVDRRVNTVKRRRKWTFLMATVSAIFQFNGQDIRATVDGELWYEGRSMFVAVANGSTFGRGMKIAPQAKINDGLFDVVLGKHTHKLDLLMALRRVYNATHLSHKAIDHRQCETIRIESDELISLDLDGEYEQGRDLRFSIQPELLQLLSKD